MSAIHIVCPHCDGVNRLLPERLTDDPQCGRCHQRLFLGYPLALDDNRFPIHRNRNDIPLLVDFWAAWCAPCRAMAPVFEQAAQMLEPRVRLIKVDTERSPQITNLYGIRSIPTLVLFRNEREIARISGALDLAQLRAWIQPYI